MSKFAFNLDDDPFAPVNCKGCGKNVFPSEKVNALGVAWHKACLKCKTCGTTLTSRNLESYQNVPYCKTHKPSPAATQVADSIAVKQATQAPRATRRVQGVAKGARMTFAPGALKKPIRPADTGAHQQSKQSELAPDRKFVAPEVTPSITSYSNDGPLVKNVAGYSSQESSYGQDAYGSAAAPPARAAPPTRAAAPAAPAAVAAPAEEYYEEGAEEYYEEGAEEYYEEGGEYYEEGGEYYEEGGEYYEEDGEYYEEQ